MTNEASAPLGDLLADLDSACRLAERAVSRITPSDWSSPTTCQEWTVRQLVNHLVTGQQAFAGIVLGTGPVDRTVDVLGDDAVAALRAANQSLVAAFADPGAMDRTYSAPIGEVPGPALVELRVVEQLAHSWDLGESLGFDPGIPDELAERALQFSTVMMAHAPRTGHPFGPEQPVSVDAPASQRFVAFLGRKVHSAT